MASELSGLRVAFLATDGVEQVELSGPWKVVRNSGGEPQLVSRNKNSIQGFHHLDKRPGCWSRPASCVVARSPRSRRCAPT